MDRYGEYKLYLKQDGPPLTQHQIEYQRAE